MRTFPLRIGTPDGLLFEGEVQRIVCRSITGDLAILAGHCNFCTALGMGEAHVILEDGTSRSAACIGGMLTVMDGNCSLLATTWEWQEDIDVDRAGKAKEVSAITFCFESNIKFTSATRASKSLSTDFVFIFI